MGIGDFINKNKLTHVDENDMAVIQQIARDLTGLDQIKIATIFSKPADQVMVGCLSAIVQQNWIIIRKLSEISQRLAGSTVGEKASLSDSRELQNNKKAQLAKELEIASRYEKLTKDMSLEEIRICNLFLKIAKEDVKRTLSESGIILKMEDEYKIKEEVAKSAIQKGRANEYIQIQLPFS
jgi:hypothetical protein